jgi:hypothetical protein
MPKLGPSRMDGGACYIRQGVCDTPFTKQGTPQKATVAPRKMPERSERSNDYRVATEVFY